VSAIPPGAVEAAAEAIGAAMITRQSTDAIARAALEAAWPHLLAAAGKLLTEDDCRRIMQETIESQKPAIVKTVRDAERERLFTAIRHKFPLSAPWRGEALDLIAEAWRETDG
jgi:hypothetical protein